MKIAMEKKRVLLTGGSGFIGRNVKKYLTGVCELYTPGRSELNLLDEQAVRQYLVRHSIQVVIHGANPNPVKNQTDKQEKMFEDSLRIFMNLYQAQDCYEMMYTLGSGAEYDKRRDISLIAEDEAGQTLPGDAYGLAKYMISCLAEKSEKHCNLRIFACYGPTDHESKFITHAIRCCMRGEDITIRQNCYFDYMHVDDLAKILGFFIYRVPRYRTYNVCTGIRKSLLEIAQLVREQMHTDNQIVMLKEGFNREYTGSNRRLLAEMGDYAFISIEDGVRMQVQAETQRPT